MAARAPARNAGGKADRIGGMKICLNGEARELPAPQTVLSLLQATGFGERRVAVEVNCEIVARSRHAVHELREGDRIEIIHAIGGG